MKIDNDERKIRKYPHALLALLHFQGPADHYWQGFSFVVTILTLSLQHACHFCHIRHFKPHKAENADMAGGFHLLL